MSEILDVIKKRRSIYSLSQTITLNDDEIEDLLGSIIHDMPTAFNMQSSRMVLLLGSDSKLLWDIVFGLLKSSVPADEQEKFRRKTDSFSAGHGTVLFFDDTSVTGKYAEENPLFAAKFPEWAMHQNGMLQFAVWAAFAEKGIGASLQHYNPVIDDAVKAQWSLPAEWHLIAQMPFGAIMAPAGPKDYLPLEQRMRVFGS